MNDSHFNTIPTHVMMNIVNILTFVPVTDLQTRPAALFPNTQVFAELVRGAAADSVQKAA